MKDEEEDKKDEKEESTEKEPKEKKQKDKPESKSDKKKESNKEDNSTEVGGKRIKTIGSLSELLLDRIDKSIPKIKRSLPLMLIAGINKDDHEKVKGNTIKVMARAKKEKLLKQERDKEDKERDKGTHNGIHVVTDRNNMSTEDWVALESYCRIQNYRLIKSDEEMISIINTWVEE